MTQYKLVIDKPAQKFIFKQPKQRQAQILHAISLLPHEGDRKKLEGCPGYFRLRVGTFRIIYTVENNCLTVRVVNAGNRGEIDK